MSHMPSVPMSVNGESMQPGPGSGAVDVAILCSACASACGSHSIGAASAGGVCARMSSHVSCMGSDSEEALLLVALLLVPQSSDCHGSQAFSWPACCAWICGSHLIPAQECACGIVVLYALTAEL